MGCAEPIKNFFILWYNTWPPNRVYNISPIYLKKKKSPSPLCLGGSKRVVWNWYHHLIHSFVTSVIHGPWLIFFIYPLVSPAPCTTASIKKALKYLLIEWMNFIKKNWLRKALHLVYLFQILFTLPYRNHPNLINPCRCGRIKNLDPFNRTLSPKGFWHLQMKFSSQLRVRNKSRKMCWWLILPLPLQQIQLASQELVENGLQRKQPVGW